MLALRLSFALTEELRAYRHIPDKDVLIMSVLPEVASHTAEKDTLPISVGHANFLSIYTCYNTSIISVLNPYPRFQRHLPPRMEGLHTGPAKKESNTVINFIKIYVTQHLYHVPLSCLWKQSKHELYLSCIKIYNTR